MLCRTLDAARQVSRRVGSRPDVRKISITCVLQRKRLNPIQRYLALFPDVRSEREIASAARANDYISQASWMEALEKRDDAKR